MTGRAERGSVTIWMLGLSLLLLLFGGLAIDYWRGLALQRELAAVADSAAIAGASGIDEEVYRATGAVILDPVRARDLALRSIAFQDVDLTDVEITIQGDGSSVTVELEARLELGLLGVLVEQDDPLAVGAVSSAIPVLVP
ncbi:MAG: pilus assembly protein TadG-related protein [Actinobacteria bacterium]|nr:pilus assembly protein TadG-related protein [Actinomycetota bacterium]